MAGNVTHGYDLALEIKESTIQLLLSALFDANPIDNLLGNGATNTNLLDAIIEFERSAGINVTSSSRNPVSFTLALQFDLPVLSNVQANLKVTAPLLVNHSDPDNDIIHFDLANLYGVEFSFVTPNPIVSALSGPISTYAENQMRNMNSLPILSIPVDRATTDISIVREVEIAIVDDTSPSDFDVLVAVLSMGGGTAGNISAFDSAFGSPGPGISIAVSFGYICRRISPVIERELGLGSGSFSGCSFTGNHEIRDGVKLTNLSISAAADSISLYARMEKKKACFTASAEVRAHMRVGVRDGRIYFDAPEFDDIDVDIDAPWWCYLLAGLVGALIGIIFGVVSAVVGAVILPLVMFIAQNILETTVDNVTESLKDQLNEALSSLSFDVYIPQLNNVLSDAFIDDLTAIADANISEYFPIKSEGLATLGVGDYLDLDSGMVKNSAFANADLFMHGQGQKREIQILCGSESARLDTEEKYENIRRFSLHRPAYGTVARIPMTDIAERKQRLVPFPRPRLEYYYDEILNLYAVITSEGSKGVFQIQEVSDESMKIAYRVYKHNRTSVFIDGNFACPITFDIASAKKPDVIDLAYVPAAEINTQIRGKMEAVISKAQAHSGDEIAVLKTSHPKTKTMEANPMLELDLVHLDSINVAQYEKMRNALRPVGDFYLTSRERLAKRAILRARILGQQNPERISWRISTHQLQDGDTGKLRYHDVEFDYKVTSSQLILSSKSEKDVTVPVHLEVLLSDGSIEKSIRCIQYQNDCKYTERRMVSYKEYTQKYDEEYGLVLSDEE